MTSETVRLYHELRFQLDLMHLLDGCEEADMTQSGAGATAAADLATELTQISRKPR